MNTVTYPHNLLKRPLIIVGFFVYLGVVSYLLDFFLHDISQIILVSLGLCSAFLFLGVWAFFLPVREKVMEDFEPVFDFVIKDNRYVNTNFQIVARLPIVDYDGRQKNFCIVLRSNINPNTFLIGDVILSGFNKPYMADYRVEGEEVVKLFLEKRLSSAEYQTIFGQVKEA